MSLHSPTSIKLFQWNNLDCCRGVGARAGRGAQRSLRGGRNDRLSGTTFFELLQFDYYGLILPAYRPRPNPVA